MACKHIEKSYDFFKLLKNCLNICLFIMKHLVLFHILNKHRICVRWFSHCYMHFFNGNAT